MSICPHVLSYVGTKTGYQKEGQQKWPSYMEWNGIGTDGVVFAEECPSDLQE